MMASKKRPDPFVRCFDVSDPSRHPKGHTVYRVTQKSIRVDAPDQDVQEVVVWRRYNDFKKLYKQMLGLHKALHRKDLFPPFAASKVFGRFEDAVISERRGSAQDLLNFVGQRSYLVNSQPFKKFFEGGEVVSVDPTNDPILQPVRPDDGDDDSETTSMTSDVPDMSLPSIDVTSATPDQGMGVPDPADVAGMHRVESGADLGGVWQYRQAEDDISIDEDLPDDDTGSTSSAQGSLLTNDTSMFESIEVRPQEDSCDPTSGEEGEWLITAMSQLEEQGGLSKKESSASLRQLEAELPLPPTESPGADTPVSEAPDMPGDLDAKTPTAETQGFDTMDGPQNGGDMSYSSEFDPLKRSPKVVCGRGDQFFSLLSSPTSSPAVLSPAHSSNAAAPGSSADTADQDPLASPGASPVKSSPKRYVKVDFREKGAYIVRAAKQISLAQQCEASANYHMAFTYYRNGVGILLSGVQGDENTTRREVVRRKTARYLMKAEDIYNQYLAQEANDQRWDPGQPSPSRGLDPTSALLQGPVSELKSLRVLGIINKVMLVYDANSDQTCVLKVHSKSCSPMRCRTIVPASCPYMVRLLRFYETSHALILLLQHASGGRLWNYVSGYLSQQMETAGLDRFDDDHEKHLRLPSCYTEKDDNIYSGHHLIGNKTICALKDNSHDLKTSISNSVKSDKTICSGSTEPCIVHKSPGGQSVNSRGSQDPDLYAPPECVSSYVDLFLKETGPSDDRAGCNGDLVESGMMSEAGGSHDTGYQNSSSLSADQDGSLDDVSVSRQVSADSDSHGQLSSTSGDTTGMSGFQDLLTHSLSHAQPSLESFSINSFDSDSGTASRFNSTTSEHIESIPEVTETASPVFEPSEPLNVSPKLSVSSGIELPLNGPQSCQSALELSVENLLVEADEEVLQITTNGSSSQPVISLSPDEAPREEEPPVISLTEAALVEPEPAPGGTLTSGITVGNQSRDSAEEPSIYDLNLPEPADNDNWSPNWSVRTTSPSPPEGAPPPASVTPPQMSPRSGNEHETRARVRTLSNVFGEFEFGESVHLPEGCVRQWAAEIVIALMKLHEIKFVCRDLRPANILLGERGHVLLTYFSQWRGVDRPISLKAQEGFYTAPELSGLGSPSTACDWWSLGVLLFELLTGKTLASCYPWGLNSHTVLTFPSHLSSEAESLLQELLRPSPSERLGSGMSGEEDIMRHPFFEGIDWQQLMRAAL